MAGPKFTSLAERFQKFVSKPSDTECWLWTGSMCGNYGQIGFHGRGKPILAHRASWLIAYGELPKGMQVLHRCDNGRCVNPEHLFLGTQLDNMRDMLSKGRDKIVGTKHYLAILNDDLVREIRSSEESGRALAKRLGVTFQTISDVRVRKTWKHVTDSR